MSDREAQLLRLLNRAHLSLLELAHGGEWAATVPDEVSMGAAKEQAEALAIAREIRGILGLETLEGEWPAQRAAMPMWRLVKGKAEAQIDGGWLATVSASDDVYAWSIWHPERGEWEVGTDPTWQGAQAAAVKTARNKAD